MFRLLFLTTLAALAAAKPGILHGASAPVTFASHAVGASGVSHQSRHDIINPGAVTVTSAHVVPVVTAAHTIAGPASAVSSSYDVPAGAGVGGYGTYGSGGQGGFGDGGYGGYGNGFGNSGYAGYNNGFGNGGYGNGHRY